jgi:hypothetical protein
MLLAKAVRKAALCEMVLNVESDGCPGLDEPPMDIKTFTPAACAFVISAGSNNAGGPVGRLSVPSAFGLAKAWQMCVSLLYCILSAL